MTILSACLAWGIASCTWDIPLESSAPCVADAINGIKQSDFNASVWQYRLHGGTVYFIDYRQQCCDFESTLYDANCKVICAFGGWSGSSCPDSIWNDLTDAKLLYAP